MQTKQNLKQELRNARLLVHRHQSDPGVQALLQLAQADRDMALAAWRQASGQDLVACQAQYNTCQAIIDYITKPPVQLGDEN